MKKTVCVGVAGAGIISEIYLRNMTGRFENLRVKSVCARRIEKAREKAERYGLTACSAEEMMSDPEIEMIVNLTPIGAHEQITRMALEAGRQRPYFQTGGMTHGDDQIDHGPGHRQIP